jgi:ubiquinone biosynthesis protein UbiJ
MRHPAAAASIVLILSATSPPLSFGPRAAVTAQSPEQRAEPSSSDMQDMMKMRQQMLAEMKAADAKLDALVEEVDAAVGEARINAIAAVVTELVRQHKSMHERMGQMHQHMMGGRGMMMK